jgi:hypothetical protein
MKRYTKPTNQQYVIASNNVVELPDQQLSGPAIDQFGRCEDFLELIRKERESIINEMDRLRERNQTKSVRFRELFISKLVYANIEAQLAHCGLSDSPKEL